MKSKLAKLINSGDYISLNKLLFNVFSASGSLDSLPSYLINDQVYMEFLVDALDSFFENQKGNTYVMVDPARTVLCYKIGFTRKPVEDRKKSAGRTIIAGNTLEIVFRQEVLNCQHAELLAKSTLSDFRLFSNQEFFKAEPKVIIDSVADCCNFSDKLMLSYKDKLIEKYSLLI